MQLKRLPEAELEVMLAVWEIGAPTTSSEVLEKLPTRHTWPLATLMTVLSRLVAKGYLHCEKIGRNNIYHALVSADKYSGAEAKTLLQTLYQNSVQNFVNALYRERKIGQKDIDELRSFLDALEKGGKEQ